MKKHIHGQIFVGLLLVAACPSGSRGQTFRYDADGSLIEAAYDGGVSVLFAYDLVGNLTQKTVTGTSSMADADSDGMADAWELVYFDNLEQSADGDYNQDTLSNLVSLQLGLDPTDPDTDGDGVGNVEEQAAGTNPLDPASCFQAEGVQSVAQGVALQWQSVSGKTYAVQRSLDLVHGQFMNVSTGLAATSSLTTVFNLFVFEESAAQFYRIRLEGEE